MDDVIQGNKAAWEEAFDRRAADWCADLSERVRRGDFAYFNADTARALRAQPLAGKTIGHFCCNNGRELLSLVSSAGAKAGVGFDIAENMVRFANEKARELALPCAFVAANVPDIGDAYAGAFDAALITVGALRWFRDLGAFFAAVSRCMKAGGALIINEQHPFTNMLATPDEAGFDAARPLNIVYPYNHHAWIYNNGMAYMTGESYVSRTFTDYAHSLSDILGAMCANGIMVTGMQEFEYDMGGDFERLENKGFPLSMLITGKKG